MVEKYTLEETEEQLKQRDQTIEDLQTLIDEWQLNIAQNAKHVNLEKQEYSHAKVEVFGSYKLGA
jgi:poly(A) polymerase Pap1